MAFTTTATIASFGGQLLKLTHEARSTSCKMALNLWLPPQVQQQQEGGQKKVPVLIWLSGLTCTGDNCAEKGFLQHKAAEKGIAIVYPDTSPRGLDIKGENDAYDFGTGAGFYVDAAKDPWKHGYRMYNYITEELPKALFEGFEQLDGSRVGLSGHSMGGHGALMIYLKNPGKYKSISAFAPIANPSQCPWGKKAFSGYFGDDRQDLWKKHDSTELVKDFKGPLDLLIDVGTADNFYKQGQLLPENFIEAAKEAGKEENINLRFQEGYDHSYFTIASFADDHVEHAAKGLFS